MFEGVFSKLGVLGFFRIILVPWGTWIINAIIFEKFYIFYTLTT